MTSCYLNLPGPCQECRACGSGDGELARRRLQLTRSEDCSPVCPRLARCANLRQTLGDKPFPGLRYYSFRTSINDALAMCPTGALTLAEVTHQD